MAVNITRGEARMIIDQAKSRGVLRNQLAYILGTAWHETGQFKYMREIWGPTAQQKKYEPGTELAKRLGNTVKGDGKKYLGRGFVQITGRGNYIDWANRLGIDLVNNPALAENPSVASIIIVEGMLKGTFTKKKLADYITLQKSDFVNARRIVNGIDKAELIARYAKEYDELLKKERYGVDTTIVVEPIIVENSKDDVITVEIKQDPDKVEKNFIYWIRQLIASMFGGKK